jgi:hypothetical protein
MNTESAGASEQSALSRDVPAAEAQAPSTAIRTAGMAFRFVVAAIARIELKAIVGVTQHLSRVLARCHGSMRATFDDGIGNDGLSRPAAGVSSYVGSCHRNRMGSFCPFFMAGGLATPNGQALKVW